MTSNHPGNKVGCKNLKSPHIYRRVTHVRMENKECVVGLETVQERIKSAANIIESMRVTITRMDRKD